jgi:uncharacterized membrane protein
MKLSLAARGDRHDRLDALRGAAIVWMAGFHFCFDLNFFRLLTPLQAFTRDPFWTMQRACIVTLFVFCAGLSQAVALHAGQGWPRFWLRWAQVAACAVLVSLGSAWMFPQSYIYFGILHGLAAMLVLTRLAGLLVRSRLTLWVLGALCIALPFWVQHPYFDSRLTNWVGLVTHKPITEDYAPVLPWLGVMLWGLAAGQCLLRRRPWLMAGDLPVVMQPLAVLGRWSLSFYMLHQPVLLGLLMAGRAVGWW